MENNYSTSRLTLFELDLTDQEFILNLVNTPGWIKFIGDRNIKTKEEATAYIQKIIDNPDAKYWVVKLKEQGIPIGVVTFLKRTYLEHHDIGFAFLPEFNNQGYAYEAVFGALRHIIQHAQYTRILATCLKDNLNSIKLLEKLGLRFEKEINSGTELLSLYAISTDKLNP